MEWTWVEVLWSAGCRRCSTSKDFCRLFYFRSSFGLLAEYWPYPAMGSIDIGWSVWRISEVRCKHRQNCRASNSSHLFENKQKSFSSSTERMSRSAFARETLTAVWQTNPRCGEKTKHTERPMTQISLRWWSLNKRTRVNLWTEMKNPRDHKTRTSGSFQVNSFH